MKNRKSLLLTLLAVLAVSSVFGQDIIVKRTGEKIEAKVLEITETDVRYRDFSNPDGPIYSIAGSGVSRIEYGNGDVDTFRPGPAPVDLQALSGELVIRGNSVYKIGSTRLSREQVLRYTAPLEEVARQIRAGYKMKRAAIIMGCVGGGLILQGVGLYADYEDGIGGAMVVTGFLLGGASVGVGLGSLGAQKKAMQLYDEYSGYASTPNREAILSLGFTPGGVGLQLTF